MISFFSKTILPTNPLSLFNLLWKITMWFPKDLFLICFIGLKLIKILFNSNNSSFWSDFFFKQTWLSSLCFILINFIPIFWCQTLIFFNINLITLINENFCWNLLLSRPIFLDRIDLYSLFTSLNFIPQKVVIFLKLVGYMTELYISRQFNQKYIFFISYSVWIVTCESNFVIIELRVNFYWRMNYIVIFIATTCQDMTSWKGLA